MGIYWHDRLVALSLLLALVVFAVDVSLPLGVASAVPYTFAVLLAVRARSHRYAGALAILCCALTVVKVPLFPDRGSTELWKVWANRGLAVFAIGMTAYLGAKRRKADEQKSAAEEKMRLHLADLAHIGRLHTAGQLATGLAHELNQPLAAVSLQAQIAARLAQHSQRDEAALLSSLREVTEQSQRAAAILRTLRGLVQKAEPRQEPVDLNEAIRDVKSLIDSQAQRSGVVIRLALASRLPLVSGDRIQLEQVLFNLLQNAIEAAAAEAGASAVRVESSQEGDDRVIVRVRDSGAGLGPHETERVFERFFTTKPQGMGMGLAISRSIVEVHGGRLWAVPGLGSGATFAFTLPARGS